MEAVVLIAKQVLPNRNCNSQHFKMSLMCLTQVTIRTMRTSLSVLLTVMIPCQSNERDFAAKLREWVLDYGIVQAQAGHYLLGSLRHYMFNFFHNILGHSLSYGIHTTSRKMPGNSIITLV